MSEQQNEAREAALLPVEVEVELEVVVGVIEQYLTALVTGDATPYRGDTN